jgi:hypothetical protein
VLVVKIDEMCTDLNYLVNSLANKDMEAVVVISQKLEELVFT